jgi:hypothetical protein
VAKVSVEGLERLRAKVLQRLPAKAKALLTAANDKSADEFLETVRRIIPHGDGADGHLVDTLEKIPAKDSETGVAVTIGGPDQPHPLHLEGGHRAADGSHVPAKPFWNPAKAVLRKRARNRAGRAMNAAVKSITGGAR